MAELDFVESRFHTSPITSLAISPEQSTIFTADDAGIIFALHVKTAADQQKAKLLDVNQRQAKELATEWLKENAENNLLSKPVEIIVADEDEMLHGYSNQRHQIYCHADKVEGQLKRFYEAQKKLQFSYTVPVASTLDDYVVVARSYLEEKLGFIKELEERIENIKTDAEYNLTQKDSENEEKIRQMKFELENTSKDQQERYDLLAEKLSQ